jgi:small-conductance mechanosensitive channel
MQYIASTTTDYIDRFFQHIVDGLPKLIGALLILLIGYIVAKILAAAAYRILEGVDLNGRLHAGRGGNVLQRAIPDPSHLIARIVYWLVFLFGLSLAVSALGIPALVDFIRAVYAYIPNVIAAILIFLVASAVAAAVVTLVENTMGDTPTGKVVETVGPILVMGLAIFMILNQLKIAPEIVDITYAALMGSAALGLALAFGLGGRDVAARMLEGLYQKGQASRPFVKRDMQQGVDTAKRKSDNLRRRAQ